jgi:hypothetical protein
MASRRDDSINITGFSTGMSIKILLFSGLALLALSANGQFYYKDLVSATNQ